MKRLLIVALLAGCGTEGSSEPVVAATLNYRVSGMHCQGCVDAITTEVKLVPGVVTCKVDLAGSAAHVELSDPAVEPKVEAAIEKLGYKAERDSS